MSRPLRLCIFSRILKEKGIDDAIEIVKLANRKSGEQRFFLDIYGRIEASYETEFCELTAENKTVCRYLGVKNAGAGPKVIAGYFALLFPTYYMGEGFAGTILDGFSAGRPVIANDWRYNSEIVEDGVNGFIYPYRDIDKAADTIIGLSEDLELYKKVCRGAAASAWEYASENVMKRFCAYLGI